MTQTIELPAPTTSLPDYAAIRRRQQAAWASGDFAVIGTTLQIVGETLAEAADVRAGERVLDVAAGNGNATLAAARRFARVVSTDFVASLLENGRERARAEHLDIDFRFADAEELPFPDRSFDVVLSTFGAMFAPDHRRAAREIVRVLREGGRIGLASWTPDSFVGRLLKVVGARVPPPAGVKSPALWGTEAHVYGLFGDDAARVRCERRQFCFRYHSPAHWLSVFRQCYGPVRKAFAALDETGQRSLEREILALLDASNVAGRSSLVVPSDYLEVVVTLR
jgi:ubiquinone/menaquinone biosynthesis C-methylase UbiE